MKRLFACASLALLSAFALPAHAGHGHVSVGIGVGVPLGGYYYPPAYAYSPWYGYPYPAYVPPPVVVQSQPTTYIEAPQQEQMMQAPPPPVAQASQGNTWYYCEKAKAYYPYVKECPAGWKPVPAQPAQ